MRARLLSNCRKRSGALTLSAASVREVDEAADAKAVPDLEAGEPLEEFLIEGRVAPGAALNVALDDEVLPDGGDVRAGVARPDRHLVGRDRPAALRHDLAVMCDRLLERCDLRRAHERRVDAVGRAQAIVEIGAQLIALLLLLGRDRAAVGEAAEWIEGIEGGGLMRSKHEKRALQDGDTGHNSRHARGGAADVADLHLHGRIKHMIRWRKDGGFGGLRPLL